MLKASPEVQDEIDAHPGVTQPGRQIPDPSPVAVVFDYVGRTWAGLSKLYLKDKKKNFHRKLFQLLIKVTYWY